MTRAVFVADGAEFRRQAIPGSFWIGAKDESGVVLFWYCCPCGCGIVGHLRVGLGFKPPASPSWLWNGSLEAATLNPSVNHVGHWHGWLRDGEWALC